MSEPIRRSPISISISVARVVGAGIWTASLLGGCGADGRGLFDKIEASSSESMSQQNDQEDLEGSEELASQTAEMLAAEMSAGEMLAASGDQTDAQGQAERRAESAQGNLTLQDQASNDWPSDNQESQSNAFANENSSAEQGAEGSGEQLVGPAVVTVNPPNDAVGVAADTTIVVEFSVSMNRELTQAAYQSEGLPSNLVEFSWNDASTRMTITPSQLLQYNSGSAPELVEARQINFFLSASAEDTDGNNLAAAQESRFSLLREIRGELLAVQDRDLSGSYRSDDTFGGGQCSRNDETICVGDSGQGNDVSYRGFITFDLSEVPSLVSGLASARLAFDIDNLLGEPFTLGGLQIDHTEFEEIGLDAFNREPLEQVAFIPQPQDEGNSFSINVIDAFRTDIAQRSRTQYRLSFEIENDEEEDFDAVVTSWNSHTLAYSFLIP